MLAAGETSHTNVRIGIGSLLCYASIIKHKKSTESSNRALRNMRKRGRVRPLFSILEVGNFFFF